jgi:hypothetical protein
LQRLSRKNIGIPSRNRLAVRYLADSAYQKRPKCVALQQRVPKENALNQAKPERIVFCKSSCADGFDLVTPHQVLQKEAAFGDLVPTADEPKDSRPLSNPGHHFGGYGKKERRGVGKLQQLLGLVVRESALAGPELNAVRRFGDQQRKNPPIELLRGRAATLGIQEGDEDLERAQPLLA